MVRNIIAFFFILSTFNTHAATEDMAWREIKTDHFEDASIREKATDLLFIQIPKKIEDAAVVPIIIRSLSAQTQDHYIKNLYLFIDNNPDPHAATFHLSPSLGAINIATRIRIDSFSHVRVVAEMNDGSLHMNSRFVIAAGGCSAPPQREYDSASLAKIKIKVRLKMFETGQRAKAQILINHPNASGLQFDQKNGQYIPAHYVTNINIIYNNEMLIDVETGISISENPALSFSFKPKEAGVLKTKITDSKEQEFVSSNQLKY